MKKIVIIYLCHIYVQLLLTNYDKIIQNNYDKNMMNLMKFNNKILHVR